MIAALSPRIKICGITRPQDRDTAIEAGADALGFVLYAKSPRCVGLEQLRELTRNLPPFVTPVLLFVNAQEGEVRAALEVVPQALLQFHGDEAVADCTRYQRPFLRAVAMRDGLDLLQYAKEWSAAQALLLDTFSPAYGGTGETFDWSLLPTSDAKKALPPLVLSGGLNATNVAEGIAQLRPWAVDVSSGVEALDASSRPLKGIKDAAKIRAFVQAVRQAGALR